MEDLTAGMVLGALAALISVFVLFQAMESDCQQEHNVADCELSRTPFTPVALD